MNYSVKEMEKALLIVDVCGGPRTMEKDGGREKSWFMSPFRRNTYLFIRNVKCAGIS